jgi:hypothetical protein
MNAMKGSFGVVISVVSYLNRPQLSVRPVSRAMVMLCWQELFGKMVRIVQY